MAGGPINIHVTFTIEVLMRIILYILFRYTNDAEPFQRKIHPEELWLYKNPRTESYVTASIMWNIVVFTPAVVVTVFWLIHRDFTDALQAALGVSLSICLAGTITNCIKLGVGRPRPDFFWRCFPKPGDYNEDMTCTGEKDVITEGRKSFPSGHSALSFSSLTFVFLYIAGKLHCFTGRGRGQAWRLCLAIAPLLGATMIAISRTADYHHHWQDVVVGSLIGLFIGYLCYRQFYPAINKHSSHLAYIEITPILGRVVMEHETYHPPSLPPVVSPSSHIDLSQGLKNI